MESFDAWKRKCSFCGEEIFSTSRRCRYCGSLVETRQKFGIDTEIIQNPVVKPSQIDETSEKEPVYAADTLHTGRGSGIVYPWVREKPKTSAPGNGLKVFLTVISTAVPGFGQLAGIIIAIVFMNQDDDMDRKSFGLALLIASLIMFFLSIALFVIIGLAYS